VRAASAAIERSARTRSPAASAAESAELKVLEQHVGVEARESLVRAQRFPDSVGNGSNRIDLHPSTGGRNYVDINNGCHRLHPVEWNVGEAAGALAAWWSPEAGDRGRSTATQPRARTSRRMLVEELGFVLEWPAELRVLRRDTMDPLGV
jgi:hypothetical protein